MLARLNQGITMRLAGIAIAVVAIALAGCGSRQPIYNISNAPILLPPPATSATARNVATAILRAGSYLGWQMFEEGPGQILGRLTVRQHSASIDIEYDSKSYSIKYRDSTNLDATDRDIHPEYNRWIQKLDKAIRTELGAVQPR